MASFYKDQLLDIQPDEGRIRTSGVSVLGTGYSIIKELDSDIRL